MEETAIVQMVFTMLVKNQTNANGVVAVTLECFAEAEMLCQSMPQVRNVSRLPSVKHVYNQQF